MKALVTGGGGFLGGHIIELLRQRGDDVLLDELDELLSRVKNLLTLSNQSSATKAPTRSTVGVFEFGRARVNFDTAKVGSNSCAGSGARNGNRIRSALARCHAFAADRSLGWRPSAPPK